MKRAVGVNGESGSEWVDEYSGRGCFDGKARRSTSLGSPVLLFPARGCRFGCVYIGRCDAMQCSLLRLTHHRVMNNLNSSVRSVSNAHTWVTRERKRAGVQSDNPLFSHCWKLNVNEQSVWRLPAAGYKSPLQALSLTHTRARAWWFNFKIAHNRKTYKE